MLAGWKMRVGYGIALPWLMFLAGCGDLFEEKCQDPPAQPFETFIGQEWRLVETTNPELARNLNNFDFITITFNINFTGQVNEVIRNDKNPNPILVFEYEVDNDADLISLQYQRPAPDGAENAQGETVGTRQEYNYSVGNEFEFTEQATGFGYRFVAFDEGAGGVLPDDDCSF